MGTEDIEKANDFMTKYPAYVQWVVGFTIFMIVASILLLVFTKRKDILSDTEPKQSTSYHSGDTIKVKQGTPTFSEKKTDNSRMDQKNKSGKNEINVVHGDNSGIVGGEHNTIDNSVNTVVNLKLPPRHAQKETINSIEENVPNKDIEMDFYSVNTMPNEEMQNYMRELQAELSARGYTNVPNGWTGLDVRINPPVKTTIFLNNENGKLSFWITPNE